MNKVFGFYSIEDFIDNVAGATNPIGELSLSSGTYSNDVTFYQSQHGGLHVFHSQVETGVTDANVITASNVFEESLTAIITHIRNNVVTSVLDEVTLALAPGNEYQIDVGPAMVNNADSGKLYPEWVSFRIPFNNAEWEIKVWFSDVSFSTDYELGNFSYVMPLVDMWLFHTDFAAARVAVESLSPTSLVDKSITEIGRGFTNYTTVTLEAINPADPNDTLQVPFLVGINGNDLWAIRSNITALLGPALMDQTANSTNPNEWYPIFPELEMNSNDIFRIIPMWSNVGITNVAVDPPVYSPTIGLGEADVMRDNYFSDIHVSLVDSHINYTTAVYKSIGLFILPDTSNPDGRLTFKEKFDDYRVVHVNDNTINLISAPTRQFITALDLLLPLAESFVNGDSLAVGISSEMFNGKEYLSKVVGNTRVSVLTRETYVTP